MLGKCYHIRILPFKPFKPFNAITRKKSVIDSRDRTITVHVRAIKIVTDKVSKNSLPRVSCSRGTPSESSDFRIPWPTRNFGSMVRPYPLSRCRPARLVSLTCRVLSSASDRKTKNKILSTGTSDIFSRRNKCIITSSTFKQRTTSILQMSASCQVIMPPFLISHVHIS